jgi:hypothetical protein
MQFKYPEILYALFFLLIPIFIHLFQLRRFQRIDFTNVAFLKKVSLQTRKSSQLKKWLTLLMRLLAFACIIIAFAQPFIASKTAINTEKETVIYIDNSFSMQAKGQDGPLLNRVLQQLYSIPLKDGKISWFTNDSEKKNSTPQDFKNEILSVNYTQDQLTHNEILLKSDQLFSDNSATEKQLILISDFQKSEVFPEINSEQTINVVWLKPSNTRNISIDTVYFSRTAPSSVEIKVNISSQERFDETVPVSLYNGTNLIAKSAVDFTGDLSTSIVFNIENHIGFNGKLEIHDPNLQFDNTLFFNINEKEKIKVLSINESESGFLQRIFNPDEFEYQQQGIDELNYSNIPSQHLIVLNEIKLIPESLISILRSFTEDGGSILIIPSAETQLEQFNQLLNALQLGRFQELIIQDKAITKIQFDHPIYENVFEKQVVNFQYPNVRSYFLHSLNTAPVLNFDDGSSFISQKGSVFICSAPLNLENTNFQNSPLIVPTIYNIARQSFPLPSLYYNIGALNTYTVPIKMAQDEILTLSDSISKMIPLQQTKANQVLITTRDEPSISGIYTIDKENESLANVSYNYNRSESILQFNDPNQWEGVTVYQSVGDLFDQITKDNSIKSYWKWFVIFALLFLLLEMLILKFYR